MAAGATTARRRRWPLRFGLALVTVAAVYAVLLCYPQPLLEKKQTDLGTLLKSPPEAEAIERELRALREW